MVMFSGTPLQSNQCAACYRCLTVLCYSQALLASRNKIKTTQTSSHTKKVLSRSITACSREIMQAPRDGDTLPYAAASSITDTGDLASHLVLGLPRFLVPLSAANAVA